MSNLIDNYESNRWYSIKLYVNNITDTYDIYVDGEIKVENLPFATVRGKYNSEYDISRFFRARTRYIGENCYDNMCVYTGEPVEEKISIACEGGALTVTSKIQAEEVQLFLAVYDENERLIKVSASDCISGDGGNFTVDASTLENGWFKAKAFLWDYHTSEPITQAKLLRFYQ